MYTAQALLAVAREKGYRFLTPENFKKLCQRGAFIPWIAQQGKQYLWPDYAAQCILDLCALHELNVRTEAISLSLWLLGYDIVNSRGLLTTALRRIPDVLIGSEAAPTHDDEQAISILEERLNECGSLAEAAMGLSYRNGRQGAIPAQMREEVMGIAHSLGVTDKELRAFLYPHVVESRTVTLRIGTRDIQLGQERTEYPNSNIPLAAARQLQEYCVATLLHQWLNWPSTSDSGDDEVGMTIWKLEGYIASATEQQLNHARWRHGHGLFQLLYTDGPFNLAVDPKRIRQRLPVNPRVALVDPRLHTYAAFQIAASLSEDGVPESARALARMMHTSEQELAAVDRFLLWDGGRRQDFADACILLLSAVRPEHWYL